MYRRPDVLVAGVGRTGTSFVTDVLHEDLGVCMYHTHTPPWEAQPEGGCEEKTMMQWTRRLGERSDWKSSGAVEEWLGRFTTLHSGCKGLVGLKQTAFCTWGSEQWKLVNPQLIIWADRPKGITVDSMMRWRAPKDRDYWEDFYDQRRAQVEVVLNMSIPILHLNFSEYMSRSVAIESISSSLWAARIWTAEA